MTFHGIALVTMILGAAAPATSGVTPRGEAAFAQKPSVSRNGDTVTITFETKAPCDVTAAVENAQGRIIRHLGSGVLGPNAPAPFQKNARAQTLVWDSKDDQGQYVADAEACVVRVSLGLRAQFERTLF